MTDASALARTHSERAIQALADVLDSDFSEPREVIAAANALLDRAHGKPSQAVIMVPGNSNEDMGRRLASMSDADLLIALGEARRARAAALPPIESTAQTMAGTPTAIPQLAPSGGLLPAPAAKSPELASKADRFHPLRPAKRGAEPVIEPADASEFPDTDPLAM